jgi:hypothetical protein
LPHRRHRTASPPPTPIPLFRSFTKSRSVATAPVPCPLRLSAGLCVVFFSLIVFSVSSLGLHPHSRVGRRLPPPAPPPNCLSFCVCHKPIRFQTCQTGARVVSRPVSCCSCPCSAVSCRVVSCPSQLFAFIRVSVNERVRVCACECACVLLCAVTVVVRPPSSPAERYD